MATNYSPALGTDRDRARFIVGDTGELLDSSGEQVWLLQDETIEALLSQFGYAEGVAQICEALISRFAQEPDQYEEEGGIQVRWSERIKAWKELARRMRDKGDASEEASGTRGAAYQLGQSTAPAGLSDFRL